jgi:hypothetical protein
MKKVTIILLVAMLFLSCGVNFVDQDGFSLYSVSNLASGDYLVRSTDGFVIGENVYIEHVLKAPFTIENRLDRGVIIEIIGAESKNITILSNGEYEVEL